MTKQKTFKYCGKHVVELSYTRELCKYIVMERALYFIHDL